ncbi:uncharacterized protein PHALS_14654 [Plasmopara halstedii]|uniref:Uncharacterized protein n=1 Tax=Plasmopara halstedii TaxID=4781 RepID=A0A0N7L5Y5_PLAHL|nr:uncharacterized protein PHALS_14654 [Plasmopara halstedii]CEG42771.1 hypothetical protein PHALS_14654 [Plasmopara halstedii]|eukprot:XP_024579140.1 hypothetical protein PHALS_14654 [Plasmopara halstedii]
MIWCWLPARNIECTFFAVFSGKHEGIGNGKLLVYRVDIHQASRFILIFTSDHTPDLYPSRANAYLTINRHVHTAPLIGGRCDYSNDIAVQENIIVT